VSDSTPLFNPPQNHVPDTDQAIIRVPLDHMPWAARKSQQNMWFKGEGDATGNVKNLANGK
jgi:hypothetical protein